MLCEHPAIFNRLREEVLEKLGPTDRPTFEVLKNMKYLRAVLNGKFTPLHFIFTFYRRNLTCRLSHSETLRLYPAVYVDLGSHFNVYLN